MSKTKKAVLMTCAAQVWFAASLLMAQQAAPGVSGTPAGGATRTMGTVKAVAGNALTVTADSGAELNVTLADSARVVRTAPGQKDLRDATPIQAQDIQPGDRLLVRGTLSADGKAFTASSVVVMKKTDIAEKQAREQENWRRGLGGRVTAVDPAAGTIAVSAAGFGGSQTVTVRISSSTVVRRYAPDSVKFDDATLAKVEQIKTGDQLRARGNRSADGAELAAEEVVAGTFRNISGTVVSTDPAKSMLTVMDLTTKKPVAVKISADSQLRKLPPPMAQMIAMRLRGGAGQNDGGSGREPANASAPRPAGEANGPRPGGGRGDLNQMLSRLPAVTVAELQKSDAVMLVTTQGTGAEVTAITLLTGVEPILTAPNNMMLLSPWNLSGGDAGGAQ